MEIRIGDLQAVRYSGRVVYKGGVCVWGGGGGGDRKELSIGSIIQSWLNQDNTVA